MWLVEVQKKILTSIDMKYVVIYVIFRLSHFTAANDMRIILANASIDLKISSQWHAAKKLYRLSQSNKT